jgi:protocatechuate 3,4-dioxygenase beta subunit
MKNFSTPIAALVAALLLSACGGGGGNPGTPVTGSGSTGTGTGTGTGSTVTATPTVTLAFTNASGASTTSLTGATPLTVKATVLDKDKKPVPNAIVTFATDNTLALFSPTAGTALTDANGAASVTMRAASLSAGGAGTVTATSSVAGTTITGTANYAVGATSLAFGTLGATPASLQAYGSTVLSVDVLAGSSKYTSQQVNVNFSSTCVSQGKATLAATVATNNGTAQTVYRDKGCGGNDVITVSADGVAQSAATTLTIAAPTAASVQFVSATPTTQSIVIQGQGGNGRTETATLTFKVVDTSGNALAGKQVKFTRIPATADVTINKASDTTDADGNVITTVNSGATATSFRVQATLPNTASGSSPDISTMSDSIVVTTGLPVQRAFSLSTGIFNIEGWSLDSSPATPATTLQVLLADAFGNPVPDGTPVVFQTNMGAVGSSDKGGCNTVNGGCSVAFRAQNPRTATPGVPATPCNTGTATGVSPDSTRAGVATVCASSTDGTNTVFSKTAIFFSGSRVANIYVDGQAASVDAVKDLGSISSNSTMVFQLQLNDVNMNPMPAGSTVAVTSVLNSASASVVPATVANIAPHNASAVDDSTGNTISGPQGSTHTVSVSSGSAGAATCTAKSTAFNVTVTTPGGSVTNIPFKLSFTCP